ncbi:MAG: hypothetical protein V1701_07480 [Planctomycetota bacterium]
MKHNSDIKRTSDITSRSSNDDLSLTGFKVKIAAPYFPDIPPEIEKNWLSGSKKAAPKTYKGIKKAIRTRKDFKEKIADPTRKTIASFISPGFISKSGHTHRNIMDKARDSLARAGKDYLNRTKDAYQNGRYEKTVEHGRKEYARKWCEYLGPLKGYKAGNILGLSTLAIMALGGDRSLVDYLRVRNVRVEGQPLVITTPERLNEFKNILVKRIVHLGSEIIKFGYEEQDIKPANQELNQLVNEYRRPEIIPFSPAKRSGVPTDVGGGAAASHIDFIVVEIPDPAKPGGKMKCLGLDIQVSLGW